MNISVVKKERKLHRREANYDKNRTTLASASSLDKDLKIKNGGNIEAAKIVGKSIAEKAKKEKIEEVVFDRAGYLYHGRVAALAEAARENGLKF